MNFTVSAFYKFVTIEDLPVLQKAVEKACAAHGIKGTILLASEGINGTIAGSHAGIGHMEEWLRADPRFTDLETKRSMATQEPFRRLKVKIKREIVTFGVPEANPAVRAGIHVAASEWNALICDPDVMVIDTRNAFEFNVGTFPGAVDPCTAAFNEFPKFVRTALDRLRHRKVALFCTGGIRCEKASAFMLAEGFEHVVLLKGGILKYLEAVPREDSLWQGECFVFDGRVAVQHGLDEGEHRLCEMCGHPVLAGGTCPGCPA
jgi:UPF0176 protein